MRIYVASSWRCPIQQEVVKALRSAGHDAYDFRNPPESSAFRWSDIDPWFSGLTTPDQLAHLLDHDVAQKAFNVDMTNLRRADACVLVLPSGRSAHLEAGYAVGARKPTCVLLGPENEPELMYLMADRVATDIRQVVSWAGEVARGMTPAEHEHESIPF